MRARLCVLFKLFPSFLCLCRDRRLPTNQNEWEKNPSLPLLTVSLGRWEYVCMYIEEEEEEEEEEENASRPT